MEHHSLSLDIPQTLNPYILRIDDTSKYAIDLPVDCPTLLVTAPGFNYSSENFPIVEELEGGEKRPFRAILTGKNLGLQKPTDNSLCRLPDGIYAIRYSVSPNEQVYVEYNHLRVTNLMNRYNQVLCSINLTDSEPTAEKEKKLKELWWIDIYIKAAISKVEICHEASKGMDLYRYAEKKLAKFTCRKCI